MANPAHLDVLLRGVAAWNEWQRQNPEARPDLGGADLSNRDLARANLDGADLSGARLINADLSGARLHFANLSYCDLRGANLRDAYLIRARMRGANLSGNNLKGHTLRKIDFRGADLSGADLRDSNLSRTSLALADLRRADLRGAVFDVSSAWGAKVDSARLVGLLRVDESLSYKAADSESFLALATVEGLEAVHPDSHAFVSDYISRAFAYAHREDIPEPTHQKEFYQAALERIRALILLCSFDETRSVATVAGVISDELIRHLQRNPRALHELRPRQFEELIAEILASYGWEVQLTPASKDGGYDLFAISKDVAGVTTSWIIECKKFAPEHKVGVEIARALYGVKSDLRVANAMLATTSHFTAGVEKFKASRYDFDLRDYGGVVEWINTYRPNPGGTLYIHDSRLLCRRAVGKPRD
ncbi:MAG: pentapeptide repeat-containing protein [Candidatus Rokubacteria bacterium]|nr:pentapeptide repeat-containing protein [Candidatus Rokubacteria bacterium]